MGYAFLILLILFLIYLLAICGRRDHQKIKLLQGFHYAHRGLHGNGIPENSMAAFKAARKRGYGIELDVHLLKDGTLAVFHDSTLIRTTGQEGILEDLTKEDLQSYRLEGTEETIPTFQQVLELYSGKAPLIIELKPYRKNHAALAKATCEALRGYKGMWCIESFDPRCLMWLKKHRKGVIRGQLSQNFLKESSALKLPLRLLLTSLFLNLAVRPDFVAYNYEHKNDLPFHLSKNLWGVQSFAWTVTDKETAEKLTEEGYIPIFEKFEF